MKGREIRERLQTRNVDPELMFVLCSLGEEISVIRQRVKEMSAMIEQIANISVNLVAVGHNMKRTLESIRGDSDVESDKN